MPTRRLLIVGLLLVTAPAWAQQIVAPEKLDRLRASLPQTADPFWHRLLTDRGTIYYTEAEMPRAYQHAGGFHSPHYNISGDPSDQPLGHGNGGNANVDFPWRLPGGVPRDAEPDLAKFAFFRLPQQPDGRPWPVVFWYQTVRDPVLPPFVATRWMFPRQAIVGEVLQLRDSGGQPHTFEVRLRFRTRDTWGVEVLKPFPRSSDLTARLKAIGSDEALAAASRIDGVQFVAAETLIDRHRNAHGFAGDGAREFLPLLSEALVKQLLASPFHAASGYAWRETMRGADVIAPTSMQRFGIVPAGYNATFLGNDSTSCIRCHQDTLKPARSFSQARGWYGNIRGGDGIFSWHPVSPGSISRNGATFSASIRKEFLEAGIVERFDASRHPQSRYVPQERVQ